MSEHQKERRAIQLFDYIKENDDKDAEIRRGELADRCKQQHQQMDRMAVMLEKTRITRESELKQYRHELLACRKRALTALHSTKIHLTVRSPQKESHPSSYPNSDPSLIVLAQAIGNTKFLEKGLKEQKQRAKIDFIKTTNLSCSQAVESIQTGLQREQDFEIVAEPFPTGTITQVAVPKQQNLQQDLVKRNFSATDHSSRAPHNLTSMACLCPNLLSKNIGHRMLFKGSAYDQQVQEMAKLKKDFNPTIFPLSKRYIPSASAGPNWHSSSKSKHQLMFAEKKFSHMTEKEVIALKEKYSIAAAADTKKEELLVRDHYKACDCVSFNSLFQFYEQSIDLVQNTVFQRLSQKKHMLINAEKNRKKSRQFKLVDNTSFAHHPARFSTVNPYDLNLIPPDAFTSDTDFDAFDDEFAERPEIEVMQKKVITTEDGADGPNKAILSVVNEKVKNSRRGPIMFEPKHCVASSVSEIYPLKVTNIKTYINALLQPNAQNYVTCKEFQLSDNFACNTNSTGSTPIQQLSLEDIQHKSILRDWRLTSAGATTGGGHVTFSENSNNFLDPVLSTNLLIQEQNEKLSNTTQQQVLKQATFESHKLDVKPAIVEQIKWQPLGISALGEFKKTIVPSSFLKPPKMNDIAAAVEERISLPKVMHLWVPPQFEIPNKNNN
ncbi:hypothetical protein BC830DRAFT_725227 [Chytriomyces sp. MP71]|nr:hypothetical protein BC830DRAFT_725227 [Chytriomyces sp. MP71]